MKIKILGTAAAEGWPGIFCNCDTCRKARKLKGRNIRSRSSVLIDETLMIDGGYDNFYHSVYENTDLSLVRDVFITHEHRDHFCEEDFYCVFYNDMKIYGNDLVIDALMKWKDRPETFEGITEIKPYETIKTDTGFTVNTIKAEHNGDQTNQLNYIIEHGGKRIAYLSDTGLYRDPKTWEYLSLFKFDTVISECTTGCFNPNPIYHQNFDGVRELKRKLTEMNCIKPDTPFYLTHFSHNAIFLHDEMTQMAEPAGFTVCYDGMEINV